MDIADVVLPATGLPLRAAALRFAAAGVPVFPCRIGRKEPLTRRGFRDATTDTDQVRAWWTRWPEANLGIPTGPASGLDVLDVDVHPTGTGYPALARPRQDGLLDGWAMLVRTPSGGLHAYYPADPDRPQRSWQVPSAHVDFRGDGGYVIAPPSRVRVGRELRTYQLFAVGEHHAPIDATALRSILEPPRMPLPSFSDRSPSSEVDVERLARWVTTRGEGERNRALFWAACRAAEANVPHDEAVAALGTAAEQIGLPAKEAATTIRSAYRTALSGGGGPGLGHPDRAARWGMTTMAPHPRRGHFGL